MLKKFIKQIDKKDNFYNFYILVFFSVIYSLLINPHAQEAVTFAHIANIKNKISYFESWQYAVKNQPYTFQIIIPFLLQKFLLSKIILHYLWQSLTALIAFSAVFYFSKLITRSNFFSFLTCLILINHKFINTNLYGLYYPTHFYFFGQMGMYIMLLSITAIFYKKPYVSFLLLCINFFMHAGWALPNLFLILAIFYKKKMFRYINLYKYFFTIFLSILIFFGSSFVMKKYEFYSSVKFEKFEKNQNMELKKEKKTYVEGHRVSLKNYSSLSEIIFFIIKFIFFDSLLLIAWFFCKKNFKQESEYISYFILLTFLIYFFIFFQSEILYLISLISPSIASMLDRILVNRFLNINNLIFITLGLSIFWKIYQFDKFKLDLNIVILTFAFALIFFQNKTIPDKIPYGKYINYFNIIVWFVCIYVLFLRNTILRFKIFNIKLINFNNNIKILILSLIFFLCLLSINNLNENKKRFALLKDISETNEIILLGGYVYGKFDTFYYGNNAWIIPDYQSKFINKKEDIDIFCLGENKIFPMQQDWYNYINNKCFAEKKLNDWLKIREYYNINYVIVPTGVNLKIDLVKSSNDFLIYKIN